MRLANMLMLVRAPLNQGAFVMGHHPILLVTSMRLLHSTPSSSSPAVTGTPPPSWSSNVVRPYKDKSFIDLLNAYAVFRLCNFTPLVDWTPWLLKVAAKLRVKAIMDFAVKKTFFKHFCGGENITEVLPTMAAFKKRGIGSILDLAMEADLDAATASGSIAKDAAAKVAALMTESINIAAEQDGSFIAVKVTAFVPPAVLLRWSNCLLELQREFKKLDTDGDGKISREDFVKMCEIYPAMTTQLINSIANASVDSTGKIAWTFLIDAFSITNKDTRSLLIKTPSPVTAPEFAQATQEDFDTADLTIAELNTLLEHAASKKVRVMIDAEQTYFQPAIDDVAIAMCKKFNPVLESVKGRALVFNTYQMYLKEGGARLKEDLERAARGKYTFGAKIVRGAYMYSERERAEEFAYPDPINPTLEATHKAYDSSVELLIDHIRIAQNDATIPSRPVSFVVASHNMTSVLKTVAAMRKNGIKGDGGEVAFAQLMGCRIVRLSHWRRTA
ncbi:FAD-linked oxidoreductase-like protein [Chytridium lagenaria]|nr:FAD-linked oxidoreductase-like protein [Chytridium lagenaria]